MVVFGAFIRMDDVFEFSAMRFRSVLRIFLVVLSLFSLSVFQQHQPGARLVGGRKHVANKISDNVVFGTVHIHRRMHIIDLDLVRQRKVMGPQLVEPPGGMDRLSVLDQRQQTAIITINIVTDHFIIISIIIITFFIFGSGFGFSQSPAPTLRPIGDHLLVLLPLRQVVVGVVNKARNPDHFGVRANPKLVLRAKQMILVVEAREPVDKVPVGQDDPDFFGIEPDPLRRIHQHVPHIFHDKTARAESRSEELRRENDRSAVQEEFFGPDHKLGRFFPGKKWFVEITNERRPQDGGLSVRHDVFASFKSASPAHKMIPVGLGQTEGILFQPALDRCGCRLGGTDVQNEPGIAVRFLALWMQILF
mmetsp:Transcript_22177/g.34468  ORF Transcript_22177/g.34468 Transcript_22177/m.34468 type:complete len:363 (-) Transcript_22177:245-1333(-)